MFKRKAKGFTLVELIIVIVILGILAALAVPQFVSSTKDAQDATTSADLAVMRNAMNLYYHQHGSNYPGAVKPDGSGTAEAAATMPATATSQLTGYTNKAGKVSTTLDRVNYPFGPYLNNGLPSFPANGFSSLKVSATANAAIASSDVDNLTGWIIDPTTGEVRANSTSYLTF